MALSQEDVAGIAEYAQIALADDELAEMTTYMNEAVDMLAPILEYDLDGVDPTFHPIGDLSNVMRPDEPTPGLDLDTAFANAGSTRERYFRVPSILGDGGVA
ncbi:MAG: Asp-tRNA(Asn)/Glu-tRNA(Gln) amidotransferase subunit GatC [Atopobiaceae bacterium]|jgi:aspartyl-tRNA(Asn)/glutamyl-tRNA(Gln) amidotransferase subunit C|nr:Asp-tRNA(Asn)/Glu-tRNA(Gln) amidotransferase subunit GatC [Atopobiaceae bacterium]MCI2172718.1 Asp-tRNA(Asn)/Glu-tRNA(Gln) amidotransferase subunit GatC [Atopobiaceae bacterium]MCI2207025.1 Asp-tRNA(Asn)/Glu-tRNA(Gln) amidotransferase subunit GatC [Atopobiaceae bacterium]